jgi:hypothetical protein
MTTNLTSYHGIVHGTTIELGEATGLPDGLEVRVIVQPANADAERLPPGEGLRRAFGAWAEDAEELDAFQAEIRRARQRSRREVEP